jgi:type I restriction enzyme S subunit
MNAELLFETDLLFANRDAIERLRELCISMALSGRLTSKNGETGNSRIWRTVRLDEAATIVMGNSPKGDSYNDTGNGVPLINGPVEFSPGPFGMTLRTKYTTAPTKSCREGDLLICVRGSTTGRTNIAAFDACIGRGVAAISANEYQPFINLAVRSLRQHVFSLGTGSTFPSVSYKDLASLRIPQPPLAEQKRIVAKVDELMGLCDQLEAQLAERETKQAGLVRASLAQFAADPTPANLAYLFHPSYHIPPAELRKTILTLAVQGKLVPHGESVEYHTLQSILAQPSLNGVSKGPTTDQFATEILRISAGTSRSDFYVDEHDFKHVNIPEKEVAKYRLLDGDLLACRFNGNLHYVGRFSLYSARTNRLQVNPDKLIRFRIDQTRFCPRYMCLMLNSPPLRTDIEAMCSTTAGNIGLSASRLNTVRLPIPSLTTQRQIASRVDELLRLVDTLEHSLLQSLTTASHVLNAMARDLTAAQ